MIPLNQQQGRSREVQRRGTTGGQRKVTGGQREVTRGQRQVTRQSLIQPNQPQSTNLLTPPPPPPPPRQPIEMNQSPTPVPFAALNQPNLNASNSSEEFHLQNDDSDSELIIDEEVQEIVVNNEVHDDEDVQEMPETENIAPQKGEIDDLLEKLRDSCNPPPQMTKIDFNFVIKDLATIKKVIQSDSLTDRIFRSKISYDVFNRKYFQSKSYY